MTGSFDVEYGAAISPRNGRLGEKNPEYPI
jgi:hypothetical protein